MALSLVVISWRPRWLACIRLVSSPVLVVLDPVLSIVRWLWQWEIDSGPMVHIRQLVVTSVRIYNFWLALTLTTIRDGLPVRLVTSLRNLVTLASFLGNWWVVNWWLDLLRRHMLRRLLV